MLAPPQPGIPLLLYLIITGVANGAMLAQLLATTRKEQAIYYISKKLLPYKVNYMPLDKSCVDLALVT